MYCAKVMEIDDEELINKIISQFSKRINHLAILSRTPQSTMVINLADVAATVTLFNIGRGIVAELNFLGTDNGILMKELLRLNQSLEVFPVLAHANKLDGSLDDSFQIMHFSICESTGKNPHNIIMLDDIKDFADDMGLKGVSI